MRRLLALALVFPFASACTVSEQRPPPSYGPPPPAAGPVATGPLPAGTYEVRETVAFDTCHPSHALPQRVSVLKRTEYGAPRLIVPVPAFGVNGKVTERTPVDPRGYKGSGMAHPKVCPGTQQQYRQELVSTTPTSFRIDIEYEVADAWDCPGARPGPICRTGLSYEYTLVQAACPAECDAGVPGQPDEQVPPGPVQLSCACR